jgi:rRNA-processing protein FCF1
VAGPVAVLDADVLVPILSCDLLLSAFDADLYQPVVTAMILGEVERTLRTDFGHLDPEALGRRARQVRTVLAFHTRSDPVVTDAVVGVNAKDRHVAALAIAAQVDVVVSNDGRLRRQLDQLAPPVPAANADRFALRLLHQDRNAMHETLAAMVAKRRRPPVTRNELIGQLAGAFPHFTAALRQD